MGEITQYSESTIGYDSTGRLYDGDDTEDCIYKVWAAGDLLTAFDLDRYAMQQMVMKFSTESARATDLASAISRGTTTFIDNTQQLDIYNTTGWTRLAYASTISASENTYIEKIILMG